MKMDQPIVISQSQKEVHPRRAQLGICPTANMQEQILFTFYEW
jgi:hypothetical protein